VIRRSTAALLLLGALLVLAGCGSKSDHGGTIIYSSSIGDTASRPSFDLYAAAADGSSNRRLTNTPNRCEENPVLTRDQRSFYFYSGPCLHGKGPFELWRMDIDGSNARRIPIGAGVAPFPSPDGIHILVVDRKGALWLRRLDEHRPSASPRDGGKRFELPRSASIDPIGPILWSPDGTRFVFAVDLRDSTPLFVLDLQTLEVSRLTSPPETRIKDGTPVMYRDVFPVFSPDDRYLAYARMGPGTDISGVRLMDTRTGHTIELPLGSEKELLMPGGGGVPWFFSSDGTTLVYRLVDQVGYSNRTIAIGVYSLLRHEQRVIDIPRSWYNPRSWYERHNPRSVLLTATSPDHTRALVVKFPKSGTFLTATDLCGRRLTRLGKLRAYPDLNPNLHFGPLAVWAQPGASSSSRPSGNCELTRLLG
jgi:hypothetical protein